MVKNMELEVFDKLYNRIQLEPSILLLGQSYFLMGGKKDPVWDKLVTELYPELGLSRKRVDYPTLWQNAVKTPRDAELVMAKIAEAGSSIWKNPAVAAVAKLRWSLLFTSAIDDTEVMATEKGYSPVPPGERNAKAMYLNKERRFRINLCGSREVPPPVLKDKLDRKKFDMQITNRIRWISSTYLEYYGVLVIDGFDPDYDWLNDENLFGQLIEMLPQSIYWFSAPECLGENAAMLVERGILVVEEDGLYEHLLRHMPELLESGEAATQKEEDNILYTSLTLRLSDRQTHTVHIRRSDISDISGSSLCVIDDDMMRGEVLSEKSRAEKFADFLMQNGLPSWHLFNTKANEEPFYIARDQDKALEERLFLALRETGVARKPVILCGPSNSGKSMMLARLAWFIANRRKYPVIFIRGELVSGAEKRLDKFISNWFGDADRFGGERPEKVVVIWDGSGLRRTEQDYENLQGLLFNRNAQVVGSVYSSTREKAIALSQDLSVKEEQRMHSILASLGRGYVDRFNEILRNRKNADVLKNSSLLYLLQALFKYEFDSEYQELAKILASQFNQEKRRAEQETSHSLQKYVEDFFQAQRARVQCGVASSFQEKLQLILAQMMVEEQDSVDAELKQVSDGKQRELEKYKQLSQCITSINNILAVASEFGVQLPLHLLLSFLRTKNGSPYVSYTEEPAKIIEILRTDTLLEFNYKSHPRLGEEYYVSFRNSIEAENYICLLCNLPLEDHSPKRKEKEIEIFTQLVEHAETEVDLRSVIELGRQFGPNGHGMLSEIENMSRSSDYLEYKNYWLEIANAIIDKFQNDPETILLYAHLTREYVSQEEPEHRTYYDEVFIKARTMLQTALDRIDTSTAQYDRLSVELCANYQQTLRVRFDPVIHSDIKKRIRVVFRRSKQRDAMELRRDFSSNYMLDILLNAYNEFRKSNADPKEKEQELVGILCDIDDMLNLDNLVYERKNQDLIRKIREVYGQLGSESTRMDQLEKKLMRVNNDAFLYLQARMIWQGDTDTLEDCGCKQDVAFLFADHYIGVCRDIPYIKIEMSKELSERLTEQTRRDAQRVVDFLSEKDELVRRTQSERCMAMLMRAKWFLKTGTPMLEEKQCVPLSREEWQEINELCNRYHYYHQYHKDTEPFIPAYFLKGVYEWIYGDVKQAIDWFNGAKGYAWSDKSARSVERLILCKEETSTPRTFVVSVQQGENKKYTARIIRETTPPPAASDMVATRYGLGVAPPVVKYLFDGTMPKEQRQQAKKDGIIRFNLIGAQVGSPQSGGMNDDQ